MKKVEVILEKWGRYKKGDTIEMPESTAKGCIKSGAVKAFSKAKKPALKN